MTLTLTPINVLDAAATSKPITSYNDGTNNVFAHTILDSTGALISPATSGKQDTANTALAAIQAAVTAATPAGSAIIGKVTTDQTAHGTTDLVAADITKVAGTAISQGHGTAATAIRVELPTDGTGVVGLIAGSAVVGKFTTDQTTHGTTDLVAADITKVAGSAIAQGHGTAATAIRVELPTDGTGVVGLAAGSAKVGIVTTDQTTHGTTDLVAADITKIAGVAVATGHGTAGGAIRVELPTDGTGVVGLSAGTAVVGKFTTDQTTHGTTDLVAADVTKVGGSSLALGQALAASSVPVVLTAAQITSLTAPVLGAGTAIAGKFGIDQTTPGTTDSVTPKATESHLGEVGGRKVEVSTEITRPADTTAYAAGDSVNTSTSAATVITFANFARISGGTGYITKVRIATDKKSITPRFRLHLFNASPTLVNDNAAFARYYADESKRIGYVDLPAMFTPSDTSNSTLSEAQDATIRIPFVAVAGRAIYGVLETLDAFTPASGEKFNVTLAGDLD